MPHTAVALLGGLIPGVTIGAALGLVTLQRRTAALAESSADRARLEELEPLRAARECDRDHR